MKRQFRLTRSTEIKRVRHMGKSYAHPFVVLVVARQVVPDEVPGGLDPTHIAVIAGRSVGGAIQRNRCKRRLRSALQPFYRSLAPGWNAILLARQPLNQAGFRDVQTAVKELFKKAHLFLEAYVSA